MKREYKAQRRYGYIGIDEYLDGQCLRTIITGIKPQRLGRQFAVLLQVAYEQGCVDSEKERAEELIGRGASK